MKNLTKTFLGAASLMGLFAGNAYADSILGPDFSISAAVAVQSDYRFRGISQNDKEFAPQATVNITGPDGWYAGVWSSKVDWGYGRPTGGTNDPSYEVDLYGGKHTTIFDTDVNLEAYYYAYPDFNVGPNLPNASYLEFIAQLSHTFGPVTATGTWAYSAQFAYGGGDSNYLEGTLSYPVTDWLSVSGNFGHQWVQNAKYYLGSDGDYSHFDIGATITYKSFTLDGRYVGTNANAFTCSYYMGTTGACSGGFIGTLTYNISAFPW